MVVVEDVSVLTEEEEEDEEDEEELCVLDAEEDDIVELEELEAEEDADEACDDVCDDVAAKQVTVAEPPPQDTDSDGGFPPVRRAAFPDTESDADVLLVAVHLTVTEINETEVLVFAATSHSPVVLPDTNSSGPLIDNVACTAAASLTDALTEIVAVSPAVIELGPDMLKDALAAETGKLRIVKSNASINETLMIFLIFYPSFSKI